MSVPQNLIQHPDLVPTQRRLMEFIRQRFRPGYNHYNVSKLIGDASSRQYFRYVTDAGISFILAAYPEAFDPTHFTFGQIYGLLKEISVPVPEIIDIDGGLGIVLQEDLGNESLQKRIMREDQSRKLGLLKEAIDHILAIQERGSEALRPEYEASQLAFDEEKLTWEFNFFKKHYLKSYRKLRLSDEEALDAEFRRIAQELSSAPRRLCHRDYHVRNLMVKEDILYVIDFQDARWGPLTYDLVSLLKDSIDLSEDMIHELIAYYRTRLEASRILSFYQPDRFERQFHLMCIQRLLKALGTYGYQIIVRENFIYEQYMAGSLHRALLALETIPEFPEIRSIVERELHP